MTEPAIFSEGSAPSEWSDTDELKLRFGTKAAALATLPRRWTPAFVLISRDWNSYCKVERDQRNDLGAWEI